VHLRFLLLLLLSISVAACSGPRPLSGEHLAVTALTELPPPNGDAVQSRTYRVGAFDTFQISVFGVDELSNREIRSDAGGRIAFPLVGAIEAQGMTLDQVSTEIENRLRGRFIREPHVSVNVRESNSQSITVNGQVHEPGIFPILGPMTLQRAIARAKGVTDYASSDVVVFRTVGEQRMAALYSLHAIQRGAYADPDLYANDIVVVGDSPGRRMFQNVLQILPLAITPLVALIQNNGN